MTRTQVIGFGSVVVLLLVALVVGSRGDRAPSADALQGLRSEAALAPCPTGVSAALPDLVLPCLGGGPDVELRAAASGRPTLVNVWGSWCAPCAREADELVAFSRKAGDRVALLGVLTQDSYENGLEFSADVGWTWPSVVDDDGTVMRAYAPGPPITLLVRGDGTVAHVQRGEFTSLAQVEGLVAEHLGVRV